MEPYDIAAIMSRTRNWNVQPIPEDDFRELGYLLMDFLVVEFANYFEATDKSFDREKFYSDSSFRKGRMQEILSKI